MVVISLFREELDDYNEAERWRQEMKEAACRLIQSWWIRKSYHPRTLQAIRNFKNKHTEYVKFLDDEIEAQEGGILDGLTQAEDRKLEDKGDILEEDQQEQSAEDRRRQEQCRVQEARDRRQFARFSEVANNIMLKGAAGMVLLAPSPTIARLKSYCNERSGEFFIAIPLILSDDEVMNLKLMDGLVVDLTYTFDDGDDDGDDDVDETLDGPSDTDLASAKDPAFALRRALFCPVAERTADMQAILMDCMSGFRRCFKELTDIDVSKLIAGAHHRWVASDAAIFLNKENPYLQGTPHDACYIVADGQVNIVSKDVDDRPIEHLARCLGQKGYVGELGVVRDDGIRTHDAFAGASGADLIVIVRDNFKTMVEERRVRHLMDITTKGVADRSEDEVLDLLAFLGIGEEQETRVDWFRPHFDLRKPSKTPLVRSSRALVLKKKGSSVRDKTESFGRTSSGGSSGLAHLLKSVCKGNNRQTRALTITNLVILTG